MENMENIIQFLEQFFIAEAKVATLKRIPDLENYNKALDAYFSFLVPQLRGATGHMPLSELRSEAQYERLKRYPPDVPRHVYKLSEYQNDKYATVWIAYVSQENPRPNFLSIENALFIIQEDGLKIARYMLWTNYTERGDRDAPFRWDGMWGYRDLNFETIVGPNLITRILEPQDRDGSLEIYNSDI